MAEQVIEISSFPICGGTSSEKDADEEIQALVDEVNL